MVTDFPHHVRFLRKPASETVVQVLVYPQRWSLYYATAGRYIRVRDGVLGPAASWHHVRETILKIRIDRRTSHHPNLYCARCCTSHHFQKESLRSLIVSYTEPHGLLHRSHHNYWYSVEKAWAAPRS